MYMLFVNHKYLALEDSQTKAPQRDFPGGPVAKALSYNAGGTGSNPGRGTKIPHIVRWGQTFFFFKKGQHWLHAFIHLLIYFTNIYSIWSRKWQSIPVFLPGKSHGQRSLAGYSPWDRKESDTTKRLSTSTHHWPCEALEARSWEHAILLAQNPQLPIPSAPLLALQAPLPLQDQPEGFLSSQSAAASPSGPPEPAAKDGPSDWAELQGFICLSFS